MMKDCGFKLPFIGEFYFEWRKNSKGCPFYIVRKRRHEWVFCMGYLCGYFAPFES